MAASLPLQAWTLELSDFDLCWYCGGDLIRETFLDSSVPQEKDCLTKIPSHGKSIEVSVVDLDASCRMSHLKISPRTSEIDSNFSLVG